MSISKEEMRHIARLARLAVSDDDVARLQGELADILNWMAMLDDIKVDSQKIISLARQTTASVPLRADDAAQTPPPEVLLRNAPMQEHTDEGVYFAVPKTLE